MAQEVSVSYQAIKGRVHKLLDALVENEKNQEDVRESMRRWWKLIPAADRKVAQKYLLTVIARSSAGLAAITDTLFEMEEFEPPHDHYVEKVFRMQREPEDNELTRAV
jgi:C4-type Zn-finger protein